MPITHPGPRPTVAPRLVLLFVPLASTSLIASCATLSCGPGTHQAGNVCVPDAELDAAVDVGTSSDAGTGDAGSSDAGSWDADASRSDAGPNCVSIAAPPSDPGSVGCADITCAGGTVCVIDGSAGTGRCYPPDAVPSGASIVRECDEAGDCDTGAVCCLLFRYGGAWSGTTTSCETSCAYGPSTQMCATSAECGGGGSCEGWSVSGGQIDVATCRAPIGC